MHLNPEIDVILIRRVGEIIVILQKPVLAYIILRIYNSGFLLVCAVFSPNAGFAELVQPTVKSRYVVPVVLALHVDNVVLVPVFDIVFKVRLADEPVAELVVVWSILPDIVYAFFSGRHSTCSRVRYCIDSF